MAKNHKEQERKNLANKFDAQGRSLLSLEEERQAEKRKDDKMMKEISEIIDAEMLAKTLPKKKFFILHINTLVEVKIVRIVEIVSVHKNHSNFHLPSNLKQYHNLYFRQERKSFFLVKWLLLNFRLSMEYLPSFILI